MTSISFIIYLTIECTILSINMSFQVNNFNKKFNISILHKRFDYTNYPSIPPFYNNAPKPHIFSIHFLLNNKKGYWNLEFSKDIYYRFISLSTWFPSIWNLARSEPKMKYLPLLFVLHKYSRIRYVGNLNGFIDIFSRSVISDIILLRNIDFVTFWHLIITLDSRQFDKLILWLHIAILLKWLLLVAFHLWQVQGL